MRVKLKKRLILVLIIVFSLIRLNQPSFIKFSKANPVPVDYIGGILPKENLNLSLTNADVLFQVNTTDFPYYLYSFNSNYTIFNPNEQVNVTIAIPFLMEWREVNNLKLRVNDKWIPFSHDDSLSIESEIWQEYLDNIDYYGYSYAYIFNISIPANDSVIISCSFDYSDYMRFLPPGYDTFELIYIVGTARIWNGNITERIEYEVSGRFPDSYTPQEDCNVSIIEAGRKYTWEWDNEVVEYNYVGISWHYVEGVNLEWLRNLLISMGFTAIVIASISIYFLRKKRMG